MPVQAEDSARDVSLIRPVVARNHVARIKAAGSHVRPPVFVRFGKKPVLPHVVGKQHVVRRCLHALRGLHEAKGRGHKSRGVKRRRSRGLNTVPCGALTVKKIVDVAVTSTVKREVSLGLGVQNRLHASRKRPGF